MSADARIDWRLALPHLVGPGVTLREPRLGDAARLMAMLATDEVGRFMSRPPEQLEAFATFIEWTRVQRRLGRNFCYGIVPDGEAHPVGLIQVRQLEPGFASAEWGFAVGQPYWGNGLFARAAHMAIDFIFRHTAAHRLEARSAIQNGRANGALKKVGASPEGLLRQAFVVDGEPIHQVLWSLHIDQWSPADSPVPYRTVPVEPDASQSLEAASMGNAGARPEWCQGIAECGYDGFSLRELVATDAEPLVRLLASPEVGRFILPPPSDVGGFLRFLDWTNVERQQGRYACLGVVPAGFDHAVGIFQLHRVDPPFRIGEWGFVLGRPYWGTGLFTKSAAAFLDLAFDVVGARRLEARSAQANVRASGALAKLGAVREGAMKRSFLLGGEYHDDYLWAILADDWEERRAA
jgi:RimJ/RimL family protein N-acetyltransferase